MGRVGSVCLYDDGGSSRQNKPPRRRGRLACCLTDLKKGKQPKQRPLSVSEPVQARAFHTPHNPNPIKPGHCPWVIVDRTSITSIRVRAPCGGSSQDLAPAAGIRIILQKASETLGVSAPMRSGAPKGPWCHPGSTPASAQGIEMDGLDQMHPRTLIIDLPKRAQSRCPCASAIAALGGIVPCRRGLTVSLSIPTHQTGPRAETADANGLWRR